MGTFNPFRSSLFELNGALPKCGRSIVIWNELFGLRASMEGPWKGPPQTSYRLVRHEGIKVNVYKKCQCASVSKGPPLVMDWMQGLQLPFINTIFTFSIVCMTYCLYFIANSNLIGNSIGSFVLFFFQTFYWNCLTRCWKKGQ